MSRLKVVGAAVALGLAVSTATAQSSVTNMFSSVNKVIPDGQATGVSDTEILSFSDPSFSTITDVPVVLDISAGSNRDLYG
jgi:hypothetical protein